jgi:hypothetical protein
LDAAHTVLALFNEYRNDPAYEKYSWYALGALQAFHAGTVVALRCYLEPLTCDERDWRAIDQTQLEFEKIATMDGWQKLGEKGNKVFGILIRKAMEKKMILEGDLGVNGVTIGPKTDGFLGFSDPSFSTSTMDSLSTGFTPQYPGSLFPVYNQFDVNPLANPAIAQESFNPARLQGVGMPGVVGGGSPDQSWDTFWPKGMNLVCSCNITDSV